MDQRRWRLWAWGRWAPTTPVDAQLCRWSASPEDKSHRPAGHGSARAPCIQPQAPRGWGLWVLTRHRMCWEIQGLVPPCLTLQEDEMKWLVPAGRPPSSHRPSVSSSGRKELASTCCRSWRRDRAELCDRPQPSWKPGLWLPRQAQIACGDFFQNRWEIRLCEQSPGTGWGRAGRCRIDPTSVQGIPRGLLWGKISLLPLCSFRSVPCLHYIIYHNLQHHTIPC